MGFFTNKKLLITGGTGTFGKSFVKTLLKTDIKKIYIFTRDEYKQWEMKKQFNNDTRLQFFVGDVRDKDRLYMAMEDINIVIHAAAQKHVASCEYNPFEAVKTNIEGSKNVIEAAKEQKVENVIALSTDKAVEPLNLYGKTKAVMESLFINANNYVGKKTTKYSVVRYGNVVGSRGSVIPLFKKLVSEKKALTITHKDMTRFLINIEGAINLVLLTLYKMEGKEIFIPKIPSIRILDLAKIMSKKIQMIEMTENEKLHEVLINKHESLKTLEFKKYYIIYPRKLNKNMFQYSSDNNNIWLSNGEMKKLIKEN